MAELSAELIIEILTPWHLGSGREGGAYADSLVSRDHSGLPLVNGKSIKGLLRAACTESMQLQWLEQLTQADLDKLFGKEGTDLASQGALEVSSATLSEGEQAYFAQHPQAVKLLYRIDYNTAIDHATGAAADGSLRSMEAVVPMTLTAKLRIHAEAKESELFLNWLKLSLPLITAVGGKRRRGYGEAVFSLNRETK
ncbi:RAMP superfamily CRISPR-associated protein [Pseudomonas sp. F1_0610]|uniref:RAMP superfamily CRISPR-associated protein n=1 Tax=Pseudomonas sp. F1_0610 TaxID=3114284 RepID=UPI0039C4AD88